MVSDFQERIKKAMGREIYVSSELYCRMKNAISRGVEYEQTKCKFTEVVPEFPIGQDRADLVVFANRYGSGPFPRLVVEVKKRTFERPGPSMASAVRKAQNYATGLHAESAPLFSVYNDWELLLFGHADPFLIGVYGPIREPEQASHLLAGVEEYDYSHKKTLLNELPKHADLEYLHRRVLPSVARIFTKSPPEAISLLTTWETSVCPVVHS